MKTLSHDQFLNQIANHLDYKPDSANYSLYQHFTEIIAQEYSPIANLHHEAFELSKLVTTQHIEEYDNTYDGDYSPIYNKIKYIRWQLLSTPILSTITIDKLAKYIKDNRETLGYPHLQYMQVLRDLHENNYDNEKLYCTLEDYLSTDTNPLAEVILTQFNR